MLSNSRDGVHGRPRPLPEVIPACEGLGSLILYTLTSVWEGTSFAQGLLETAQKEIDLRQEKKAKEKRIKEKHR